MTPQEAKRCRERAERYKRQREEAEARASKTMSLDADETQTSRRTHWSYIPDELPDLDVMLTALCEHLNIRLAKTNKLTLLQNYAQHCSTSGLTPHEIVYVSCSNKLLLSRIYGKKS